MTVGQQHRLEAISEWLAATALGADWCGAQSLPEHAETWTSRTATLHRFTWTSTATPDVVVKVHRDPAEALTHFRSLAEVAQELDRDPSPGIVAIRPLAMSAELGTVVMPHVAGTRLSDLLMLGYWKAESIQRKAADIAYRCGILLARYHDRTEVVTNEIRRVAHDRLVSRFERVLKREVNLDTLAIDGPIVKCYRDFHPSHIIVTEAGEIAAIDPPIEVRHDYYYRDLALFTHSLHIDLIDPRGLLTNPRRVRHRESLVAAFLDGYATTSGRLLSDDDIFCIEGWEAYYLTRMLRKALRSHSYGRLAYYYRPVQRRRSQLIRAAKRRLLPKNS